MPASVTAARRQDRAVFAADQIMDRRTPRSTLVYGVAVPAHVIRLSGPGAVAGAQRGSVRSPPPGHHYAAYLEDGDGFEVDLVASSDAT